MPLGLQGRDNRAGNLIGPIARMMEFQVGDRARRAANRLTVHLADDANETFGPGINLQYVSPLVVQFGSRDRHESNIVDPRVETQTPDLLGVHHAG